jgi:hypothetical protein
VRRLEAAALVGAWGLQIRKVLWRAGPSRTYEAFVGGKEKETVTAKMARSGGTFDLERLFMRSPHLSS